MNVQIIASKAFLKLKNASPTIALAGGIACGIGATIAACKATPKVDALIEEAKEQVNAIHQIADDPNSGYSVSDKNIAIARTYGSFIAKLAKNYAPAIALEAGSIALLLWSHHSMTKRVFALGATVVTLSESLKRMRAQISEQYGEEKANDIYYGLENQKVEEIVVDEETGKESKKKVQLFTK